MGTVERYEKLLQVDDKPFRGEVKTPVDLVNQMLDKIPQELFKSNTTTFLDPSFGNGTFLVEIIKRLRREGHSIENIQERVYGVELTHRLYNKVNMLLSNYNFRKLCREDFLTKDFKDMKFDVVVGNPPYNLRKGDGGNSGTIGNKTYYRKFVSKGISVTKQNGILLFVTLKNVMKQLKTLNIQVDLVNLMTEKDYWKYDTLYFLARNTEKKTDYKVVDPIISKVYSASNDWNLTMQASSLMQLKRDKGAQETLDGPVLLRLKGKTEKIYGTIEKKVKLLTGPKFLFAMLESVPSYTVTAEDAYPHCSSCVKTATIEEAEKLKLFTLNNKLFKYFTTRMKLKAHAGGLSKLKKFDLTQIQTGYEYPREFNLSREEIEYIEQTIK